MLGYTAGGSLIFYTFTTYMQKYLINTAGMSKTTATNISLVTLLVYMCIQPLFGALSDRIGRRLQMMLFGVLGALFTVPIMTALGHATSGVEAGALVIAALAIVSLYTSVSGIVKAEMFPMEVRALGVGLGYAISNAIFGGSAEYVALQLKAWHMETSFFWYVTAMMMVVTLVALVSLPRRGRRAVFLHSGSLSTVVVFPACPPTGAHVAARPAHAGYRAWQKQERPAVSGRCGHADGYSAGSGLLHPGAAPRLGRHVLARIERTGPLRGSRRALVEQRTAGARLAGRAYPGYFALSRPLVASAT